MARAPFLDNVFLFDTKKLRIGLWYKLGNRLMEAPTADLMGTVNGYTSGIKILYDNKKNAYYGVVVRK